MGILSRFAHKIEKNGYVARFNSLKNIPVFYESELDDEISAYLDSGCKADFLTPKIESAISLFEKNKILVESNEYDDAVLNAVQNSSDEPYISIMYLILTEKCNFNCSYCFVERHMDHHKATVMTEEVAKSAVDFFVKQINQKPELFEDEKSIIFYGGEPLSNYSVLKYAAHLINEYISIGVLPKKTEISMVTNGSFITKEIAKELSEMGVSFSISLDGATPKANRCRVFHNGNPAYDEIIRGIEAAKEADVEFGLSITLSEEALQEKDSIVSFIDKYDIKGIGYNILNTDKTFSVQNGYYERASNFIINSFRLLRNKGIYEDRISRKIKSFTEHELHYFDCGAVGGHQIVVAPNGDVGICHGYLSSRKNFVTNVRNSNIDIAQDPLFIEWGKRTPFNMPQCQDCMALGICGGGCALCAAENHGSIWDLDEGFCIHAKTTLEFLIWDLFDQIQKDYFKRNEKE